MEQENFTGVIHFAGTAGGFRFLCKHALHYPVLAKAAVPLLLSVAWSFQDTCPHWNMTRGHEFCDVHNALRTYDKHYKILNEKHVHVMYNPGRGNFTWLLRGYVGG